MNVETLHPVAKLTQAYPKTFGGAGSAKACFAQRLNDELPLECSYSRRERVGISSDRPDLGRRLFRA
jgi:hypothetical protein